MDGNVNINNQFKDIDIFNSNGDVNFVLSIGSYKLISMKINVTEGDILGSFKEGNIIPNPNLINENNNINKIGVLQNCVIYFNLNVGIGKIEIN